jgi:hypothetical protein
MSATATSINRYELMRAVAARGGRPADWLWRSLLISDRILELEDIEAATENALVPHAAERVHPPIGGSAAEIAANDDANINIAVLHLRNLIETANAAWAAGDFDYAEIFCEQCERALIDLRQTARTIGVIQ